MVRITRSLWVRGAAATLAATSYGVLAGAQAAEPLQHAVFLSSTLHPRGLHRVGHEPMAPDPTIRRYTGKVTAVGAPDATGKVVAFESVPVGPRSFVPKPGELRTWRMTVLSGKRFGTEYRVGSNTDHEITVKPGNAGTLEGLAVNDVFVVESIDENGASMFATPQAAATPGNT